MPMTAATSPDAVQRRSAQALSLLKRMPPQQLVLLALVAIELLVFSIIGTNFFTVENFLQVPRLNVELGLLALALTPVIVTGGIDLSVGSLLGLCAILFGKLWRDAGLAPWLAALLTLVVGLACGGLNAVLITRLRIAPLIVTLGSFSLFRGIAEGVTGGVDNFTSFPPGFLFLGQGSIAGIPTQLPILFLAAVGFYLLLHRSVVGRGLSAIGYSPEGARHAGIRVERQVALVYVLSGFCAALAAVIYAARVGQAKADAGAGYELSAVTAVVLGGTSIFGGRGSIIGTLLGLLAIALLENGLQLAEFPGALTGILTGLLLLVAICVSWKPDAGRAGHASPTFSSGQQELDMRNSQLAVLSAVILAAALIVAGGNYLMLSKVTSQLAGGGAGAMPRAGDSTGGGAVKKTTIAMMPKSLGNAYFIAARKGAEDAAKELGVNLLWNGPSDPDPAKQNEIVERWITQGVDVIAVACENRDGISTALRKAKQRGIQVVTWDSDAQPDARDFFVNQATPQGIGHTLMDTAAKVMNNAGEFAIITASLTAANMNEWRKHIDDRLKEKYPNIRLADVRPCDDIQTRAFEEARTIMNRYPDVKLIMAICSPAVPGAAEAVKQSEGSKVKVIGLGLPNENKQYVHAGITEAVILWNTMNLGYLTVVSADMLHKGKLKAGDASIDAGRLGKISIAKDNILLGEPFVFTKENIDQFDF